MKHQQKLSRCCFSEYIALRDFFENMLSIFGEDIKSERPTVAILMRTPRKLHIIILEEPFHIHIAR